MDTEDRALMRKAALITAAVLIIFGLFTFVQGFFSTVAAYSEQLFNFLLPFVLAFIAAYVLKPIIDFFESKKIPRSLVILVIYLIVGTFLVIFGARLFSAIIIEIQKLISMAPQYAEDLQNIIRNVQLWLENYDLPIVVTETIRENIVEIQTSLTDYLDNLVDVESFYAFVLDIFGHILSLVAFPIVLFYFLKDYDILKDKLISIIPVDYTKRIRLMIRDVDRIIGAYIRSQLIICAFIGVLTYLGLLVLGVDFALTLGVVAGITNLIPYFGPFIGAIPSTIVAFIQSPTLALKVVILITIIQQVESQLLAPQVYGKNLALHPLAVIAVLTAGGHFFGLPGMILAVPIFAVIRVILRHVLFVAWLDTD